MKRFRRRKTDSDQATQGSDSFLDVVANVVGILIILVIVAGLRVGHWVRSDTAAVAASAIGANEVETARTVVSGVEAELAKLAAVTGAEQARLAATQARLADLDSRLASQRSLLTTLESQHGGAAILAISLREQLRSARDRVAELETARGAAEAAAPEKVTIETYPTPISRAVEGDELHFQRRGGLVAAVPLMELIEAFKVTAERDIPRLRHQSELTGTVGPIGGFRLRYMLDRVDLPVQTQLRTGVSTSYVRLNEFKLLPVLAQMGETAEEAFAPASQFRAELAGIDPRETAITMWVYPDSFALFRELKRELFKVGFQVAGRPLPEGELIGGSPQGSRSVAQ